jgi:hypothetical protein
VANMNDYEDILFRDRLVWVTRRDRGEDDPDYVTIRRPDTRVSLFARRKDKEPFAYLGELRCPGRRLQELLRFPVAPRHLDRGAFLYALQDCSAGRRRSTPHGLQTLCAAAIRQAHLPRRPAQHTSAPLDRSGSQGDHKRHYTDETQRRLTLYQLRSGLTQ